MRISESPIGRYPEAGSAWHEFRVAAGPLLGEAEALLFELYNRRRGRRSRFGAMQDGLEMLRQSFVRSVADSEWHRVRTVFVLDGTGANGFATLAPLIERYVDDRAPVGIVTTYRTRKLAESLMARLDRKCCIADIDHLSLRALRDVVGGSHWRQTVRSMLRDHGPGALPYLLVDAGRRVALAALIRQGASLRNLFVANERTHASALALSLGEGRLRRICIQHGAPMAEYLPIVSDHYWAWDAVVCGWLRKHARSTKVDVFGNPRAVRGHSTSTPRPRALRPRVLFAAQPLGIDFPDAGYLRVIDLVLGLAERDVAVVTSRLHPADKIANYPNSYRAWAEHAFNESRQRAFGEAMRGADIVVSYASTSLFEAAAAGLGTIALDPEPCPALDDDLYGVFARARTVSELVNAVCDSSQSDIVNRAATLDWPRAPAVLDEDVIDDVCAGAGLARA